MDVTLYPDEDWTVDSTWAPDLSAVTLTAPDGSEVRFEGDFKVLRRLADRMMFEVTNGDVDTEVTANGRNPDATLDAIDAKIDNLETLLRDYHAEKGEERRYPDDFRAGDWVQFPPSHVWRKVDRVGEHPLTPSQQVVSYTYGGVTYSQDVRAQTRYPYCTAARFDEVCDR
jgi:hypothetical protein